MKNIKLVIEYDGTNYHGWQSQVNARAVHDEVKKAIVKLTGEDIVLIGSSRTDAGVHALGLAANFHTGSSIPPDRFSYALNHILPQDIVVKESSEVPHDFHARFWAKGKRYRYLICNTPFRSALYRTRAYHVSYPLDLHGMQKAAEAFVGTHDFSAFKAAGGSTKTDERTITSVKLDRDESIVRFEVTGDGFLYNMVRIMAGTLVEVGMGRMDCNDIPAVIESRDRKRAGRTAPPQGLYLVEVLY